MGRSDDLMSCVPFRRFVEEEGQGQEPQEEALKSQSDRTGIGPWWR